MALFGGAVCRTPVSSPARQKLCSCKFWPAWTGIKTEASAVAVLADVWTNVVTRQARIESDRDATCVSVIAPCNNCEKESGKSISSSNLEATRLKELPAGIRFLFLHFIISFLFIFVYLYIYI